MAAILRFPLSKDLLRSGRASSFACHDRTVKRDNPVNELRPQGAPDLFLAG
jgi:hypothetical protein